jgi:hypothetical protein
MPGGNQPSEDGATGFQIRFRHMAMGTLPPASFVASGKLNSIFNATFVSRVSSLVPPVITATLCCEQDTPPLCSVQFCV